MPSLASRISSYKSWFSAAADYGEHNFAQGISREATAVISFFAILIVGVFIVSKIDGNLDVADGTNYSDAANQTSGGLEDTVDIGVVVPVVVFAGIMLGVVRRFS